MGRTTTELAAGDGQNTDPQSMDYPNGLPKWTTLKWTTPKNTILDEYCDFILTLHEPAYFCSAWPSAAILNNYTNNNRWTQKA